MAFQEYFAQPQHLLEKQNLPLLRKLITRYRHQKPISGITVVFGHLLVRNSLAMIEALVAGGAKPILAHILPTPVDNAVRAALARADIPVNSPTEAVRFSDIYIDVNAILGRVQAARFAAEVTRTGIHHYQKIPTTVISADDSLAKRIEGFFGTGDGFVRAWNKFCPVDPLGDKQLVQFGYGKIGRGIAFRARDAGARVSVVDTQAPKRQRAGEDGFAVVDGRPHEDLRETLARAEIIVLVTGIPGFLSEAVPAAWIRANQPVLVILGDEDEFGPAYHEQEILEGRNLPLNFHNDWPTLDPYIDPPLAAHLMALEAWHTNPGAYPPGIHPLPKEMDQWIVHSWRAHWPNEDVSTIAMELGLE